MTDLLVVATVKEFRKGDYIKLIDKNGNIGNKVYIRGAYDIRKKKYVLFDTNDIFGNGRLVSGLTKACDTFNY